MGMMPVPQNTDDAVSYTHLFMIQHRIKEREPQYMDMKEIITEAARKLVLEKKVKKLTVKDIVEECQITRQAFYYHFEGIPDLIQWSIKQGTRRLLEACKEQGGAEAALKYLFVFAINAIPEVRKGIESNYGKELEQTLMQDVYKRQVDVLMAWIEREYNRNA